MRPQNWSSRVLAAFSRRSNQRPVSVSKLLELRMYLESLEDRCVPATFTVRYRREDDFTAEKEEDAE